MQSLANQLGWMITTKDYLIELSGALKDIKTAHAEILNDLRSVQYVNEGFVQVASMTNEVDEKVDLLIKHINDEHLEYVEKQTKNILQTLEAFK